MIILIPEARPLARDIYFATQGNERAHKTIRKWLDQVGTQESMQALVEAIEKLLAGERTREVLLARSQEIDETGRAIFEKVLATLVDPQELVSLIDEGNNSGQPAIETGEHLSTAQKQVATMMGMALRGDEEARRLVEEEILPALAVEGSDYANLANFVRLLLNGEERAKLQDAVERLDLIDQAIMNVAFAIAQS